MSIVSVIIPAYNSAAYLPGAVNSVLQQTLQDFEIIIVNDGSKDDTEGVVKTMLTDSRVRCVSQENRGLPGARNAGARVAVGKYLAFLDADDYLAPSALAVLLREFEATGAAWANVGVLRVEGSDRTALSPYMPAGNVFHAILRDDFIRRCPFFRATEFADVGMYDEEMKVREDWDINIRLIQSGKPYICVDEPLYLYTCTEGSITRGNRRRVLEFTEKLLHKYHKRLADAGDRAIAHLYAINMWEMGRVYHYQMADSLTALRCLKESVRYDFNVGRLLHALAHRVHLAFRRGART